VPEYAKLFADSPKGEVIGECPRCKADVTAAAKGFFCSNRACTFALWKDNKFFSAKGVTPDRKMVSALLKDRQDIRRDYHTQ
jgi:DNA topoisomerase-3